MDPSFLSTDGLLDVDPRYAVNPLTVGVLSGLVQRGGNGHLFMPPIAAAVSAAAAPQGEGLSRLAFVLGGSALGSIAFPRLSSVVPRSSSLSHIAEYLLGHRTGQALGAGVGQAISMAADDTPAERYYKNIVG
jgi:hypothetical protein